MAPFLSIMTTLYALAFLSFLMEFSSLLSSIPVTRITNKDSTRDTLLFPGDSVLGMSSLSSCRKFVHFPSRLLCYSYVCPEYTSFRDQGIQKGLLL